MADGLPEPSSETDSPIQIERRKRLAVYNTRLALIFLVGHEMAHITNGHLSLDPKNIDAIIEICIDVRDPKNILRAMENDADLFAIYQTFGLATEAQKSIFDSNIICDIETDPTKRLKCAMLAILVCLNLFDCFNPRNITSATPHPSYYDRVWFAQCFMDACLAVMLTEKKSAAKIDSDDLSALAVFVRVAALRITGRSLDFETVWQSLVTGELSAEHDERVSAWRTLGAELERHQHCDPAIAAKIRSVYS